MDETKGLLYYSAKTLTTLLHPFLTAPLAAYIIFNSGLVYSYYSIGIKNYVYYIILGISFALPLILAGLLPVFQKLYRFSFSEYNRYRLPIAIYAVFVSVTYTYLNKFPALELINGYLLSLIVITIIFLSISFFLQLNFNIGLLSSLLSLIISINTTIPASPLLLTIGLLSISLIASSLLFLNKSNSRQIYLSFLIGFLTPFPFLFFQ